MTSHANLISFYNYEIMLNDKITSFMSNWFAKTVKSAKI